MNAVICVPTFDSGENSIKLNNSLIKQNYSHKCIIIDSSSNDNTVEVFKQFDAYIYVIDKKDFNHGATRQLALTLCPDADIIIYMTQDAILASPDSIKNILTQFEDEK
ncbi:MAG: glycosyltransferase, partial [Sedimentibacter sp.]